MSILPHALPESRRATGQHCRDGFYDGFEDGVYACPPRVQEGYGPPGHTLPLAKYLLTIPAGHTLPPRVRHEAIELEVEPAVGLEISLHLPSACP